MGAEWRLIILTRMEAGRCVSVGVSGWSVPLLIRICHLPEFFQNFSVGIDLTTSLPAASVRSRDSVTAFFQNHRTDHFSLFPAT